MKTNIIFLDFDGPLTNRRAWYAFDKPAGRGMYTTADPVAIGMLNDLALEFQVKVVISSSWRLTSLTPTKVSAPESLRAWGYKGAIHPHWRTRYYNGHGNLRTEEIMDWIDLHQDEIGNFCAIDDDHLKKHVNWVQAHPDDGISYQEFDKARNFLSGGGYSVEMALKKHGSIGVMRETQYSYA